MCQIAVWAPQAECIELETRDHLIKMDRTDNAWWTVNVPFIKHGTDYAFRIDGKDPMPDPRSAWQPEGVHGFSRWVSHSRFDWEDSGWQQQPLGSAMIYELHVGTFTPEGTFDGVISRLEHLQKLGITHIELMPVAAFPGSRGWGYDGVNLYAPHHAYGGPDGLKRLVNACHQRNIAVLLDVVYNHLGPSGNYLPFFGPYFTDYYGTPWGEAVNFDGPDSDEVRRFFVDNALMWLRDYHMDGLRIDAVHAIMDTSAVHFLEQLSAEVEQLERETGRHLVLIAESDLNDPRIIRPPAAGGYGIDAQWNEDFHHALHAVLTGEKSGYYNDFGSLKDLAKALTSGFVYDGRYSLHRRRFHGRPAAGLPGHQFVGCLQNHDQVGNRALGERTSHLLSLGQLKIGAALVLTSPFVPMLFQGEEWAASTPFLYFTDHREAQLGNAVKEGRQKEFSAFGWDPETIPDPQEESTFYRSVLKWEELDQEPHRHMFNWHQSLIDLRRRFPSLLDSRMNRTRTNFDEEAGWFLMVRGSVLVVCNFSENPQHIPLTAAKKKNLLLASADDIAIDDHGILLPGQAVVLLTDESSDPE